MTIDDNERLPAPPRRSIARSAGMIVLSFIALMLLWSGLFFASVGVGLVVAASAIGIVLVGIGGILYLLSFGPRKDYTWRKVLLAAVLIGGPPVATEILQGLELDFNQARGQRIALAVKQFNQDNGLYPQALSALGSRQMNSVPWCWYGLVPRPFTYWLNPAGKPRLQFNSSAGSFWDYDFDHARWTVIRSDKP
jgi:hypothetical protein